MNIVVFGGRGLLGTAIANELATRGHTVRVAARHNADIAIDMRFDAHTDALRPAVRGADIVVNAIGVLIERDGNRFDLVHRQAAEALVGACEAEHVARIVHISALSVGTDLPGGYIASKLAAEQALAAGAVDYAIVRPGLLVADDCPSTRLFRSLSRLPVIALPGLLHPGASLVSPIRVADVARCVARIAEHPKALRRVIELTGPQVMRYRDMLARYRTSQGLGTPVWLPTPWWLMKLSAHLARWLPQKVFSIDTVRMLRAGSVSGRSETARWLGREPLPMLDPPGKASRAHAPASAPASV